MKVPHAEPLQTRKITSPSLHIYTYHRCPPKIGGGGGVLPQARLVPCFDGDTTGGDRRESFCL